MKLFQAQGLVALFLAALLSAPAWATAATTNAGSNSAVPGTINYVEGQANIGNETLDQKSVGKTTLEDGQTLDVDHGKVEILLTPGVFLRVGDNSSVTILSNGLANTEVRLDRGHAIVEVDDIYKQNDLRVIEGDVVTRMVKPGLYDFNLRQGELRVFDGQAEVQDGDKQVKVKGGHELAIDPTARVKEVSFHKKDYESGDLYNWSSLRSSYLAEANIDEANAMAAEGWGGWGGGFWGPGWGWGGWGLGFGGWGWDPWFSAYTFMPWGGICYSPFGWGFYSPGWVYRAPFYGGHYYHTFNAHNVHAWGGGEHYATSKGYSHGVYTGAGAARGAFHSGSLMAGNHGFAGFHGGGFHGGGGGFHGGGFHGGGFGGGGFGGGGHGGR
ncbi:MAG: hypothetical protein WAK56_21210 [Candidatus Sulfotelmatobacter sp.]